MIRNWEARISERIRHTPAIGMVRLRFLTRYASSSKVNRIYLCYRNIRSGRICESQLGNDKVRLELIIFIGSGTMRTPARIDQMKIYDYLLFLSVFVYDPPLFWYSQLFVKRSHLPRLMYRLFVLRTVYIFPISSHFIIFYWTFFHYQLNITVGLYSTWPNSWRFYLLVLFAICCSHCIRDHIQITCLVISEQIVLKLPFRIKLPFIQMDGCFSEAYGEK